MDICVLDVCDMRDVAGSENGLVGWGPDSLNKAF